MAHFLIPSARVPSTRRSLRPAGLLPRRAGGDQAAPVEAARCPGRPAVLFPCMVLHRRPLVSSHPVKAGASVAVTGKTPEHLP